MKLMSIKRNKKTGEYICNPINVRLIVVQFLNKKIAKTTEAEIPPKWVMIIYCILFPVRSFYRSRNKWCDYNVITDEYTIEGIVFRMWELKAWDKARFETNKFLTD